MKNNILKAFSNNLGFKILAVLFAFTLWLTVYNIEDPTKSKTLTINVTVANKEYIDSLGKYFEIKDDCWSHVIPVRNRAYDYHLYTLKDTGKNKDILKLSPEDFELVHKKQITKPEIETLPFGTYLMMSMRKFGSPKYFIVSIKKAD